MAVARDEGALELGRFRGLSLGRQPPKKSLSKGALVPSDSRPLLLAYPAFVPSRLRVFPLKKAIRAASTAHTNPSHSSSEPNHTVNVHVGHDLPTQAASETNRRCTNGSTNSTSYGS